MFTCTYQLCSRMHLDLLFFFFLIQLRPPNSELASVWFCKQLRFPNKFFFSKIKKKSRAKKWCIHIEGITVRTILHSKSLLVIFFSLFDVISLWPPFFLFVSNIQRIAFGVRNFVVDTILTFRSFSHLIAKRENNYIRFLGHSTIYSTKKTDTFFFFFKKKKSSFISDEVPK